LLFFIFLLVFFLSLVRILINNVLESLGLVFLLFSFAPLHFWIFNVMNSKLPFLLVLLQFILRNIIFVLVLGLLMCIIQMLLTKSYKNLLILSSTESFNWVLMGFIISFFNVFLIFLYYFFIMLYLIPKYELIRFKGFLGWETMLVFINLPFRVRFFVKIFALTEMLKIYDLVVLLLLFMIFLSVLSLINLSVKNLIDYKYRKIIPIWGPSIVM
uniref:NADH dehydrogenase subunit 2 n=1 Tax=Heligmosomoides polygyrus TaxID=6339 RepID=A0A183GRL5_HELPZ